LDRITAATPTGPNRPPRIPQLDAGRADERYMRSTRNRLAAVAIAAGRLLAAGAFDASPASAAPVKAFSKCMYLQPYYHHGVARPGARDRVRGKTKPVTNFKVSAKLYNLNKRLDADHDGVACEKR
jgi:hypothetical protein